MTTLTGLWFFLYPISTFSKASYLNSPVALVIDTAYAENVFSVQNFISVLKNRHFSKYPENIFQKSA